MTNVIYSGDRVKIVIVDWHSSFRDMRGTVVHVTPTRVGVRLDGDQGVTLFFRSEVKLDEVPW
jgi:hypothetical protein